MPEVGGFRTVHFDSVSGFPEEDLPDWVVLLESPLVLYTNLSPSLARVITSDYTEAHRVEGVPLDGPGWYDQHDAFFVPLSGFRGVCPTGTDGDTLPALHGPGRLGEDPRTLTGKGRLLDGRLANGTTPPVLSVVVPCHNEQDNVGPLLERLIPVLSGLD